MRVLFVTPDLPYPPHNGGKIRNYNLLRHVAERHEVTLVSFDRIPDDEGRAEVLRAICDEVIVVPLEARQTLAKKRVTQLRSMIGRRPYHYFSSFSRSMQRAIDEVVDRKRFDVIQIESAQMGYHRFPASVPVVLDEHNVEYDLLRRVYTNERFSFRKFFFFLEWKKFERDELAICRSASLCSVMSERDKELFRRRLPDVRFEVVPNGVDTQFFARDESASPEEKTILFTGTIDYYPNADGLGYFFDEILPLIRAEVPEVRFIVAGRNPPPSIQSQASQPGVTVTGFVDDIRPYYDRAEVVVVPLRIGGGTRLKILEAMAMEKAIVSTSVGAEGIDVTDGENIVLADDPASFATEVVRLLKDPQARQLVAEHGGVLARGRYDWRAISNQLGQTHEELLGIRGGST